MSYYSYYICKKIDRKYIEKIQEITNHKIVHTIKDAEVLPKKINSDLMIIAPTTGNTIAKLANSISDTPITIAVKSHIKNRKPLVIFIYTNDGLSSNACNVGTLLNRKHIFFVPFRQENPITKPYSLSSDTEYIIDTIKYALKGEQIEPIIL